MRQRVSKSFSIDKDACGTSFTRHSSKRISNAFRSKIKLSYRPELAVNLRYSWGRIAPDPHWLACGIVRLGVHSNLENAQIQLFMVNLRPLRYVSIPFTGIR
jgi:hypothetical protein